MNKFVLIDGNAILHRAFHALPPLTSSNGDLANAVYGFFSMFLKIVQDVKPTCIAVCFDRPKPTFRKTLYVGYQAQRPKMDNELVPQIALVHKILKKAGVQIFEIDGYEADDVIGTIANQSQISPPAGGLKNQNHSLKLKSQKAKGEKAKGVSLPKQGDSLSDCAKLDSPRRWPTDSSEVEVIIVSGDRDMLQLVNSHVKVLAPIVGITNMILFDQQKVEEKYGIKPTQIIDYKSLVGDASDNYPGVSGIGPKTARDLLQKYSSLESLYGHLGELPPKIAEKLSVDAEQAALAKKLATIVTDAPAALNIDKCSMGKLDKKGLVEEFEKLGFKSLIKRVQSTEDGRPASQRGEQKTDSGRQKTEKTEKNGQMGLL